MLLVTFTIENVIVAYSSVACSVLLSGNHFPCINALLWQGYKTCAQWTTVHMFSKVTVKIMCHVMIKSCATAPCHEDIWKNVSKSPCPLNFVTRWRSAVSFNMWPLYPWENNPQYLLNRWLSRLWIMQQKIHIPACVRKLASEILQVCIRFWQLINNKLIKEKLYILLIP
jgi:hypothetical protein